MEEATLFAPAGRSDAGELNDQQQAVLHASFITAVLHAVPDMMLVLNNHRQIVGVNSRLLSAFGFSDQSPLLGLRPGEAIGCIHSCEGPDGCGTSESCSACGAVLTILESQETGCQAYGECRISITKDGGTALDMEVTATPLDVTGIPFTIFALKDISSDKRRQVLERTFLHDILNTVGGIRGIAGLLAEDSNLAPETEVEYKGLMVDLSDDLVEEISQQGRLLAAERGEYVPEMKETDLAEMLQEVCKLYGNHSRTPDRTVILEDAPQCRLKTDRSMLRRVVGNMVLNALEATPAGGAVRVRLVAGAGEVRINVINAGEITKEVQLRLFNRSFSTKSKSGRGIGTYSMKLFGERYLGGRVGFTSQKGETVFFIKLPS
ncbi:MAG: ATP-binding protein [Desulfuromonadaceae bacterium]|nr:ATP-binding protein [Desulfuromonadaceae bacterium]